MTASKIEIKVVPNASQDQVVGWFGDDLKIRVQSPPEGVCANKRLCRLLAEELGLPNAGVGVESF